MPIPDITRPAARRYFGLAACALALVAATACGKKGPPLPPFAKAPAVPSEVSVRRQGSRVEIRFTVPTSDLDGQKPANLDRIEVWALTGPPVDPALFLKHGTLVGTVPVRKPPPPPPDVEEGKPAPPPPPPSTEPGLDQGQPGIVVDELTPEALTAVAIPEVDKRLAREEQVRQEQLEALGPLRLTPPDLGPPLPPVPMRYYLLLGRNGGRRGAVSPRQPVPLTVAPPAPPQPTATVAENYIELTWTAPEGLRQPVTTGNALPVPPRTPGAAAGLLTPGARTAPAALPGAPPTAAAPGTPTPPAAPPVPDDDDADADLDADAPPAVSPDGVARPEVPVVAPPTVVPVPAAEGAVPVLNSRTLTGFPNVVNGYNVYEVAPPHLTPAPLQPGEVPLLPRKLTPAPIAATTWRDVAVAVGAERCYVVRTVEVYATRVVESEPSPALCVSPTDTFPPKAPTSLAAVASEGAIALIWDANTEPDLAGYIVLRSEAGAATMQPLMTTPITETTYRDATTKPGVRYAYAVVAVDTATPQNVSTQSNKVEETAR